MDDNSVQNRPANPKMDQIPMELVVTSITKRTRENG